MIHFVKKYRAFGLGALITVILRFVLEYAGVLKIRPDAVLENAIYFIFWSVVISLPIHHFAYLKANKLLVFKILGLIAFLTIALIADATLKIPDNPLTIFFLTGFWIAVVALVSPQFFHRYRYYILGVYGLLLSYFSYVRISAVDFESYVANSKESVLLSMILPIPVFALIWVYEQWKWVKSLQSQKTEAELSMLKAQINPHFFFNTLNNLYSLTVTHSEQAPEVILKLSDMMRYTIYEGEKERVKLQDEIMYLNNYLDLHKIRYKKKVAITFTQQIEEHQTIAPMLFITLLENALKHGVESMTDQAYVNMHVESKGGAVHFSIENNFDAAQVHEEKGIGLANLQRRLNLIYPNKHTFTLEQQAGIFKAALKISRS